MLDPAVAILDLHAAAGQTRQVEALAAHRLGIAHGRFDDGIHAAAAAVLAVGQHGEAPLHRLAGPQVGRINPALQGITHQGHADPIEILDQQQRP